MYIFAYKYQGNTVNYDTAWRIWSNFLRIWIQAVNVSRKSHKMGHDFLKKSLCDSAVYPVFNRLVNLVALKALFERVFQNADRPSFSMSVMRLGLILDLVLIGTLTRTALGVRRELSQPPGGDLGSLMNCLLTWWDKVFVFILGISVNRFSRVVYRINPSLYCTCTCLCWPDDVIQTISCEILRHLRWQRTY